MTYIHDTSWCKKFLEKFKNKANCNISSFCKQSILLCIRQFMLTIQQNNRKKSVIIVLLERQNHGVSPQIHDRHQITWIHLRRIDRAEPHAWSRMVARLVDWTYEFLANGFIFANNSKGQWSESVIILSGRREQGRKYLDIHLAMLAEEIIDNVFESTIAGPSQRSVSHKVL